MTSFGGYTEGKEVIDAFGSHAAGKTIVLTGPSAGGIGAHAAVLLALANPGHLILAGRTLSKIQPVIDEISKASPNVKVTFLELDLGSQAQVRTAAEKLNKLVEKVDILINNAAILCPPEYTTTVDGIEAQFGINHIGHFLFTNLIIGKLIAAKNARIVNVSSTGYTLGEIPFDDVNWDNGKTYHPWKAYAGSKAANILFGVVLTEKLRSKGIVSVGVHPGQPKSNLANHVDQALWGKAYEIHQQRNTKPVDQSGDDKSLTQAAAPLLDGALNPRYEEHSGKFLRNCDFFETETYASDPELGRKLWTLSEELVKEKFEY